MAMRSLHKLTRLARLTQDIRRFLRTPELAIYGHPGSPYLQLLRAAGCEFGDLESLVVEEGLEGSFSRLVALECTSPSMSSRAGRRPSGGADG